MSLKDVEKFAFELGERLGAIVNERDRYREALEWIDQNCSLASDPVAWQHAHRTLKGESRQESSVTATGTVFCPKHSGFDACHQHSLPVTQELRTPDEQRAARELIEAGWNQTPDFEREVKRRAALFSSDDSPEMQSVLAQRPDIAKRALAEWNDELSSDSYRAHHCKHGTRGVYCFDFHPSHEREKCDQARQAAFNSKDSKDV